MLGPLAGTTASHLSIMSKIAAFTALCAASAVIPAAAGAPAPEPNNGSFLGSIHPYANARLRYEYADIDGMREATLGSLRTRFGINTDPIHGFSFLAEGEHTWVLTDSGRYTAFPPFPNNGRSVIPDPDNFELNRLQLSYHAECIDTTVTVGRQSINLADQRFVGAVGWRQNDQTFDAVVLENKSLENFTFTYAFVGQVNRIFGEDTPAQALDRWEGGSHLIHLEFTGIENHTLRAFAYLLDFDQTAVGRANSCDTYGIELQGTRELASGNKLGYLATVATQGDAGQNPADYREHYYRLQVGLEQDCCNYGVGAEVLTGDGMNSFLFPLGTNHKFNGFADAFLATPKSGLVDYYAWIGTKALGFTHRLAVHQFRSEHHSMDIGWEIDYVAVCPVSENAKVVLKAAHLDGKGAQRDITRASAELNFSF